MPRMVHMTWVASQKRWTKMHKGTRYYVSTRELGTGPTQEESIAAANSWWETKRNEIDGRNQVKPGTPEALSSVLEAWAGSPVATADESAVMLDMMSSVEDRMTLASVILGPERFAQVQASVQVKATAVVVPPEKTVGALVARWIADERQRLQAGQIGPDRMDSNRRCLVHFSDFLGAQSQVNSIDEMRWSDWYGFLASSVQSGRWNTSHVNRIYAVSKRFVKFCWECRLLELPRNLEKRTMNFAISAQVIEIFSDAELAKLWAVVGNQTRLHVALSLNCGFTAVDINDLRQSEVDWDTGVITRKRSKTEKKEAVPVVRYKLWPQTFELLKQWRSEDAEIVLLTQSGNRWIIPHQGDVSYTRSDCMASALRAWMKRAKVKHPPKALRATAASKLGEHPSFKFYVDYFLGHAPKGVSERHYVKPVDKEFFEALAWLEGALHLITKK